MMFLIEVFHIEQVRLSQALPAPLNKLIFVFQLVQQFDRFLSGTSNRIHDFIYRTDDVGISILVLPAIFKREIHPIQQDCIKQLCIARHLFKQYQLLKNGLDNKTLDTLKKNRNITLSTLEKLCQMLDCTPNDVVQFIPDDKK